MRIVVPNHSRRRPMGWGGDRHALGFAQDVQTTPSRATCRLASQLVVADADASFLCATTGVAFARLDLIAI
jgi:hypothetical protein